MTDRQDDADRSSGDLFPVARQAITSDQRRIAIVGANGWIGHALLALLDAALGRDDAQRRIVCFGSQDRRVDVAPGLSFPQQRLDRLGLLQREPTILFHLAFLTKDKVGSMPEADYIDANRALSRQVEDSLDRIGADRLFVASSGAAAFANDADAAYDLRLYGSLKREDEVRFAAWSARCPGVRRALVTRIFNISGPYINKHQTYALSSFILSALASRPIEVRAPQRVIRGYVAIRELLSLVIAALLAEKGDPILQFDSGGEPMELEDVARRVAHVVGGVVERRPITVATDNRYVGDDLRYRSLIGGFGITHIPLDRQIAETAAYLARTS